MKRLFLLAALVLAVLAWQGSRPVAPPAPVFVQIEPGLRTTEIAARLAGAGILRSRWFILAWHYLRWKRPSLRAGEYHFEGSLTPFQVYGKLVRGEVFYRALVIPEGYNQFEVAAAAERAGFCPARDFLQAAQNTALVADLAPEARTLEGFLFPDTYHFSRRATATQIVRTMVLRFRQVFVEVTGGQKLAPNQPLPIVTLASLVEKEARKSYERGLVAGVFRNRLDAGLPLQCDPTVIYAAILEGEYSGTIYASDLSRDSPYNTYVRRGLPPGPVANPGRAALVAAINPVSTDYMYFVSDSAGGHIFSRTLAEHQKNVEAYRRKNHARRVG